MQIKPAVLDRLLLSKSFLERIRFQPAAVQDRYTLAASIIAAHDAAELAIAAICDQRECLPRKGISYLMDYFEPLKAAVHPDRDVLAKEYFRSLNTARNVLKHQGLFPDAQQWARAGESVFQYIVQWCRDYLGVSLPDLDEAALIWDEDVRRLYDDAKRSAGECDFKAALEKLSMALSRVFEINPALHGFEAGLARTEDAIRVAGFGVHGNDFLSLQKFLPYVSRWGRDVNVPRWKQSEYGHPGNWDKHNVAFCLSRFVDVAIKLQGARWIPSPVSRNLLYELQVEAVKDGVEIWHYVAEAGSAPSALGGWPGGAPLKKEVVRVLRQTEKIRATARRTPDIGNQSILAITLSGELESLEVLASDVKVTCVPREDERLNKYWPNLPEIPWEPE
jgi:hypothetical protein